MNDQPLFTPVQLGRYQVNNRIVMAPMTRSRADNPDKAPTDMHAQYYSQRASAGLIITEGSQISPQAVGYEHTPGIHSPAQIAGWRKVSDAVHARRGRIFLQLWHVGYVSHPDFHGGALPVAPSAINPKTQSYTPQGMKDTVTPHALETHEVKLIVQDYAKAAKNAIAAGLDGVEIHGANGYLIEQFLRDGTNRRTDQYGGSVANRARFLFEVTEAVISTIGADRVGVRLSPANTWNVPADSDTHSLYDTVISALSAYDLAYLHLREAQGDLSAIPNMVTDVTAHYRRVYRGTIITNTGFDRDRANEVIRKGHADLVAFGTLFIGNPDLPERCLRGAALNQADQQTFYQGGSKGYVDYPTLSSVA